MAVSIEDVKKLKSMTGVGLTDAKKALEEADGDFDKAVEKAKVRSCFTHHLSIGDIKKELGFKDA